jgi:hypothetical protein
VAVTAQNISDSVSAPGILDRPCHKRELIRMLYAILCYHDEDTVGSCSRVQEPTVSSS